MKKTKTVNGLRYTVQAKTNRLGTRFEVLVEHEEEGREKLWLGDFRTAAEADHFLNSLPPEEFQDDDKESSHFRKKDSL